MTKELGYSNKKPHTPHPLPPPPERPPQIAFIDGDKWGIVAGHTRHTGIGLSEMPDISCPIVNISQINPQEKDLLCRKYIIAAGVTDTPTLLEKLIKAGGVVLNSKRAA